MSQTMSPQLGTRAIGLFLVKLYGAYLTPGTMDFLVRRGETPFTPDDDGEIKVPLRIGVSHYIMCEVWGLDGPIEVTFRALATQDRQTFIIDLTPGFQDDMHTAASAL